MTIWRCMMVILLHQSRVITRNNDPFSASSDLVSLSRFPTAASSPSSTKQPASARRGCFLVDGTLGPVAVPIAASAYAQSILDHQGEIDLSSLSRLKPA